MRAKNFFSLYMHLRIKSINQLLIFELVTVNFRICFSVAYFDISFFFFADYLVQNVINAVVHLIKMIL